MATMREQMEKMIRGEIPPPGVGRLVGFRLKEVGDGVAVFEMEAGEQHWNPMGTMHGGVLCDIADGALGVAYASRLAEGESFTTLELRINFLRPFWKGRLTATGRVVQAGHTVGMTECDIVDNQGQLIARASSTCMTLRGDQARGR